MVTRAELSGIRLDYMTRQTEITLTVEAEPAEVERYKDMPLDIRITQHREKRTLTANAYYWELVGKLCTALRMGKTEMHNRLLSEYGQINILPDGVAEWAVKSARFDWTKCDTGHYRPTQYRVEVNGKECPVYWVIKGSSRYDKAEMAELIDGAVDECKRLGIETRPEWEVERIWEQWK